MNTRKTFKTTALGGLAAGAVLILHACLTPVGDGKGLDENGDPLGDAPPDTNLTFVFNNVFSQNCAGCHGQDPSGDPLTIATSVTDARNSLFPGGEPRLSAQAPEVQPRWRVLPGEPDSSYLLQKVSSDSPKSGGRMPQGGELTDDEIEIIRAWIRNGASLE